MEICSKNIIDFFREIKFEYMYNIIYCFVILKWKYFNWVVVLCMICCKIFGICEIDNSCKFYGNLLIWINCEENSFVNIFVFI